MQINRKMALAYLIASAAFIFWMPDAMAENRGDDCKESKAKYRNAKAGRDKAKASIDIIDYCGLGGYVRLADFNQAFGTSFDSSRGKLPKGSLDTVVLYFDPQKNSADDSTASEYVGWYLSIKYHSSGLVVDYIISNKHK